MFTFDKMAVSAETNSVALINNMMALDTYGRDVLFVRLVKKDRAERMYW